MTNDFQFFILIIVGIFVFLIFFSYFIPIRLWIAALSSGVSLGIISLIGMRLRRIPPTQIVLPKIKAIKAGINIETDILEAHFLAGGNVNKVIDSLIAAEKASINLNFERAAAIDLAGRDVLNAVKMSVLPKVISTPEIIAVAKDGIEVKAIARITVRTNINQLVGGAIEETVIARVGEGIVTTIGSANCHKDVLENPDSISKMVLGKGLDSGTAFEILSIDIADVNIGKNIGAHLQTDQAEADKKIAQARAEQRRAFAVSAEQEMKAKVIEMKAKVVEAEAQVPLAIAESFKSGNLGVMDYYRMRNMIADTDMRESISKSDEDLNKDQLD